MHTIIEIDYCLSEFECGLFKYQCKSEYKLNINIIYRENNDISETSVLCHKSFTCTSLG